MNCLRFGIERKDGAASVSAERVSGPLGVYSTPVDKFDFYFGLVCAVGIRNSDFSYDFNRDFGCTKQ